MESKQASFIEMETSWADVLGISELEETSKGLHWFSLSLSLTWHWTDTLEPDGRFVLRMNQETSSLWNTNSSNKGPDTAILVTAFLVFIRIFSSQTWHLQIYVRYLSFKNNEVVIWKTVTFECGIINQNLESATQTGSINFRPKRQQVWFFGKIIKKLKKAGIHEILELPFG